MTSHGPGSDLTSTDALSQKIANLDQVSNKIHSSLVVIIVSRKRVSRVYNLCSIYSPESCSGSHQVPILIGNISVFQKTEFPTKTTFRSALFVYL